MNTLPIYDNSQKIESILFGNKGQFEYSYFQKNDNLIPCFQSKKYSYSSILPTVSSFVLKKVNKDKLQNSILFYDNTNSLNTDAIFVFDYTTQYKVVLLADLYCNVEVLNGIYQYFITLSDGNILFSDIFCMKGGEIATYSCSNPDFDGTYFTIDIDRTDSNVNADSEGIFTLLFFNTLTSEQIKIESRTVDLSVGGSITLTFDLTDFDGGVGYFVWQGICYGNYQVITWDSTSYKFDTTLIKFDKS